MTREEIREHCNNYGYSDGEVYAYKDGYQQGRADVLREHREQCNGKCLKCEVSVPFVNSDGEEVILPYSYSYKTDCEDNRYINAKEVLSLIKQARADTIDELRPFIHKNYKGQKFIFVCAEDFKNLDLQNS